MKTSSELLREAFAQALRRWRWASPHRPTLPARTMDAFTIAISREAGCDGQGIAREIGRLLDWPIYNRALLERSCAEIQSWSEGLEALDERPPSWLADVLRGQPAGGKVARASIQELFKLVAMLGDLGGAVILGCGASFLLPPKRTLRVRLVAPLEVRAANLQNARGIPLSDARWEIARLDMERDTFIKTCFRKDSDDLRYHDVLINTERFTSQAAAGIVVAALEQLHAQGTGQSANVNPAPPCSTGSSCFDLQMSGSHY